LLDLHSMKDIKQVLGWMVQVAKESDGPSSEGHRGVLISRFKVGAPLVVLLDGTRRFTTSRIREVSERSDGALEVRTLNSAYAVRFLHPAEDTRLT
jgi:hypothetical protein